jgi:hypothetical protein
MISYSRLYGVVIITALFMGRGLQARAEVGSPSRKDPFAIAPTFVVDARMGVARGGKSSITINAIPSYGSQISFEIITPPLHGLLSDLKITSDHTAVISYQHDGSKSPLNDHFCFRCKAPGHTKSSPGSVDIQITPPPPRLHFDPAALDFGDVILGGKVSRSLTLSNLGGTKAVGRIILPGGFSAPDGEGFSIKEGEGTQISIEFVPTEPKTYQSRVSFLPSQDKISLEFTGRGLPRFDVSRLGSTEWEVANLSSDSIRISCQRIEGEEESAWVLPPEMLLAPSSRARLSFRQTERENDLEGITRREVVRISDGLSIRDVELPTPSRFTPLTVRSLTDMSARSIPLGTSVSISCLFINGTEFSKHARWRAHSSLGGGMDSPEVVELRPGETKEILFAWTPSLSGEGTLEILIEEGKERSQKILWNVSVAHASQTLPLLKSTMDQTFSPSNSSDSPILPTDSPDAAIAHPSPPTFIQPRDSVSWGIHYPWFGKPTVFLQWMAKAESPKRIRVEERRWITPKSWDFKNPPSDPSALPMVKGTNIPISYRWERERGDGHKIQLQGLDTGCHRILLANLSEDGHPSAMSEVQVVVPEPRTWWSAWRVPMGAIVLVFLLAHYWRRRDR